MAKRDRYAGAEFWLILSLGGERTGAMLCLYRERTNGTCFLSATTPHDEPSGDVRVTWTSPVFLAKRCVQVTEREARALNPAFVSTLERYDDDPKFRAKYHAAHVEPSKANKFGELF